MSLARAEALPEELGLSDADWSALVVAELERGDRLEHVVATYARLGRRLAVRAAA